MRNVPVQQIGGIDKLKKNSKVIQALGQGIHALQGAVAHQGVDMDYHDLGKDMFQSDALMKKTNDVTNSAVLVTEIMGGNYSNLQDGMSINVDGMNRTQFNSFIQELVKGMNATQEKIK